MGPLRGSEVEGVGEESEGPGTGSRADTSLEIADPPDTEPCPLGQLFLSQAASKPQLAQEIAKAAVLGDTPFLFHGTLSP